MTDPNFKRKHFIRQMIEEDLASDKYKTIITRFPPEPNGFLHIGHAKAICLNFGLAQEFNGQCNLRFDDTNPMKEEDVYVKAIIDDVAWLGFKWDKLTYSSDYYQQLYEYAIYLIQQGKAYVDELSMEEIKAYRGTLTEPGEQSPFRNRPIKENLDLFSKMKAGEFEDGRYVLRAKIDMQAANLNLRDPVLYRIRHASHQRTKDEWCIYPMYDYAHPISDALEKITNSLCTLEFQDHRPLYDWFVDNLPVPAKPLQTEFSRLNISHTVTSKRKLKKLVDEKIVSGWDDPRMPTLIGMRKRGYPPQAIKNFCELIGISKSDSVIEMSVLEECVRNELNPVAPRTLCVLNPLKVIITNLPDDYLEEIKASYYPNQDNSNTRVIPFTKEIYIDAADFMEEPAKNYFRLAPGKEVRLRHGYIIRCDRVEKDSEGNILALYCSYDQDTLGKNPVGRKVKGVIHWVSKNYAHKVQVHQYDRLFNDANPAREEDFLQFLNPNSLNVINGFAEPILANFNLGEIVQFERLGYYQAQNQIDGKITCYSKVVDLKDSWRS